MAIYRYKAIDTTGSTRSGELDASTRSAALDVLHQRGLVPLAVSHGDATLDGPSLVARALATLLATVSGNGLSSRQLLSATRSLAALLKAGLTVDRALAIAASLETEPAAARFLRDLTQAVRAGASFSEALTATGIALPIYYSSMVEAGELGGALPQTLARATELLQKNLDAKARIQSALIYPIVLACVVLGTLVLLLAFVLPRFQALFAEADASLPWSTRIVLGVGEFTSQHWWFIVAGLIAGLIATRAYLTSPAGRRRLDRWLLQSRLTFGLPAALDTARMLCTLSTLLQNGVPLPAALRVCQGTLGNTCLRAALERVTQSVNAGEDFTTSLASAGVFPAQATQLARVGEETGRLHELLSEAASILETDAERALERLLAMMVPAVTILMGTVVAGLIGSVLVGLLSINDLAY